MDIKAAIRERALARGYDLVGFSSLELPAADRENLGEFVRGGYHGSMAWFETHLALRQEPARLFPGARTAVVLAVYYRDQNCEPLLRDAPIKIARYAAGRDYHRLLRKRGQALLDDLRGLDAGLAGRVVVDSAPVPEKILARQAGLGWQGKHTNLINAELGSYFFLSVLLINRDVEPDAPVPDLCGQCRLCLDACPTGALFEAYRLDARRCISYATIEHPGGSAAAGLSPAEVQGWAFGCDICQEVCPYNRNRRARDRSTREPGFLLRPETGRLMTGAETLADEAAWEEVSRGSPLRRVQRATLQSNLRHAAGPARPG